MRKKAQWTTLGASWTVVIVILVIFFLLSLQEVQVYKIDISLTEYKIREIHFTFENVPNHRIWFETHPKGQFNIQIDNCNNVPIRTYNNIGGIEHTFYIREHIEDNCINVVLSTDKGKGLDRKNDVRLET